MTTGRFIQRKLQIWARRSGIQLQGSAGERGEPNYTLTVEQNIFEGALLPSVRAAFERGAGGELRGDIPTILEQLDEDVACESWADNRAQQAGVPWMAPRRGRDGAAAFFGVVATMQVHDFQVLSIMAGSNQVAVEFVIEATVPSGAR